MPNPLVKTTKTIHTRRQYEMQITAEAIRERFKIPIEAELTVTVPRGGDWSGLDLTIGGDEVPYITASWETNHERTE